MGVPDVARLTLRQLRQIKPFSATPIGEADAFSAPEVAAKQTVCPPSAGPLGVLRLALPVRLLGLIALLTFGPSEAVRP